MADDPERPLEIGRALKLLLMVIMLGAGLLGWQIVRYVGGPDDGDADISSQSQSAPTR